MARAEDIWLHTQKIHSSHVVIVTQGRDVPDDIVVVAAEICEYYSQARNGGKVAVDYCRKANVKRPHKAALGFVTYTGQRTVIVEACEHREMVRG
jgi:predicted ribosome quality control (RQC) complex YloA/Tae2 family protein